MKTLSLSDVKARLSGLVDEVERRDEEIVITRNGQPAAVLVSPDEYDSWKETLAVRSDKALTREIKDVDLNETMVRAIARQAEAERERRAKVIHAEGELQASEKLLQAAQMLSKQAEAMQLRYLQTLSNIAGDKTSTIVFPVPMDLITPLLDALKKRAS